MAYFLASCPEGKYIPSQTNQQQSRNSKGNIPNISLVHYLLHVTFRYMFYSNYICHDVFRKLHLPLVQSLVFTLGKV
jgi:hypothetical protein